MKHDGSAGSGCPSPSLLNWSGVPRVGDGTFPAGFGGICSNPSLGSV